jgi:glucosamine-phosphate N-acetyltransferase
MMIRELELTDYAKGYCETLSSLSKCELSKDEFERLWYRLIHFHGTWRRIFVVEIENRIVGCATLLLERKFSHNGGAAAHVEDVAVHRDFQKQGIGKHLVRHLIMVAKENECYKVILETAPHNIDFYKKLGFRENGIAMRIDL